MHLLGLAWSLVALAAPPDTALESLLCEGVSGPCQILSVHDAGEDAAGTALWVVERGLHAVSAQAARSPQYGQDCHRYDYWLVTDRGGALARGRQLAELCNDGYGASGVGEDIVSVAPNRFTHSQMGGSAWRWSSETTVQLSPPVELSEGRSSSWMGAYFDAVQWDWTTFSGTASWEPVACDESQEADTHRYAPLPNIARPDGGWARLGDCAIEIDSSGKGGFVTHGPPGRPEDARMRVVLVDRRELWIDVEDDVWALSADSWLHTDHVELWHRPRSLQGDNACVPPEAANAGLVQWAISLSDGAVIPAHGDPPVDGIRASVASAGGGRQLRVAFPEAVWGALTVVYSDTDEVARQERLIATSPLRHGQGLTVGYAWDVSARETRCEAEQGTLRVRR